MSNVTRREFLRLSALVGAGTVLAACAPGATPTAPAGEAQETPGAPPAAPDPTAATGQGYSQSPALDGMDLPPVEERLPGEPVVVEPWESIGVYGGTWNMVTQTSHYSHVYELLQYEPMLRLADIGRTILPNVAERWEQDEDGKQFTFTMRQGIKWSDGAPLTADDVVFWFEDIVSNEDVFPAFPTWLTAGGSRPTLTKMDDYTVQFVFENPAAFFVRQMAASFNEVYSPRHYLERFHAKYADADELDALVRERQFDTWSALFLDEESVDTGVGRPVIFAWDLDAVGQQGATYLRNPYYWKVDPSGQQLPYIDRVVTRIASSVEAAQIMAFAGEAELQMFGTGQYPEDTMVLKRNAELGNYRVLDIPISTPNVLVLAFNLNHKNPELRELFNDRRFRIAMSHAIDRQTIQEVVYLGQPQESRQCAPLRESPFYHEGAAQNYVEYDPDQTNALLDEIGLTERDGDGFRLLSSGAPLAITLEAMSQRDDYLTDLEMISEWWNAVGVRTASKAVDNALYNTRIRGGDIDGGVHFAGVGMFPVLDPSRMIPVNASCLWAPAWGAWYATKGQSGEEPPDEVKRQLELYDEILISPDEATQVDLWSEIMDINAENLYHMGICDRAPVPVVVSNRFRNVPEDGWNAQWESGQIATTNPCQFWKEE